MGEEQSKPRRGGRREGAGRKPSENSKNIDLHFRVSKNTYEILCQHKEDEGGMTGFIERAIMSMHIKGSK